MATYTPEVSQQSDKNTNPVAGESVPSTHKVQDIAFLLSKSAVDSGTNSDSESDVWVELKNEEDAVKPIKRLQTFLTDSLMLPNVMVLLGSGCSLYKEKGDNNGAPSMSELWHKCIEINDIENPESEIQCDIKTVLKAILYYYKRSNGSKEIINCQYRNIEILLSKLDSYISAFEHAANNDIVKKAENVRDFCIETILNKCGTKIKNFNPTSHSQFIEYLAGRGADTPRVKIFTTNYDKFIEKAVSNVNGVVLDGFSFQAPHKFHPDYFRYDMIIRDANPTLAAEKSAAPASRREVRYVPSVFKLYKLHGSVDWERNSDSNEIQKVAEFADAKKHCIIYPTSKKYQASYTQPYLECISGFQNSLKKPNTVLYIAGFGFNDDHLSEPIVTAIKTNPGLKVIIVDPAVKGKWESLSGSTSDDELKHWEQLYMLRKEGRDINLISCSFKDFCDNLPPLMAIKNAVDQEKAESGNEGGGAA